MIQFEHVIYFDFLLFLTFPSYLIAVSFHLFGFYSGGWLKGRVLLESCCIREFSGGQAVICSKLRPLSKAVVCNLGDTPESLGDLLK